MTIEGVDMATVRRALKALGWEGLTVKRARKVPGGVEIATRYGVKVWKPVKRKRRAAMPKVKTGSRTASKGQK